MDDRVPDPGTRAYTEITVRIPDDLVRRLGTVGEIERRALEALALEEFKLGHLTKPASDAAVLPLAVLRDELRFHLPDRVVHPSLPRLAERRSGQGKNDRGEGKWNHDFQYTNQIARDVGYPPASKS